ncbi:hypothetical protein [Nocardioides sp.]|uniref:YobI family P-loop NTPase n=1 Tax=Nocardioides sp. TaxID=35761 RepID=UPI003783ED48
MAAKPLESLSPSFDPDQHGTYLRRLEEVLTDPRNRNIALTGRYGAGKSSVLDEFQAAHAESTLRLAISSLTPGKDSGRGSDDPDATEGDRGSAEGDSTTNQIQKEIVKQLLYGASEKVGRNSRFRRIAVVGWWKAFVQSAAFVACVGALLFLLGWLPSIKGTGDTHDTWVRVVAWAGVGALAAGVVTVVRRLTAGRLQVKEFSAGGAALTLDASPDSYFDKFLDEIVYYFGREPKDIVIFEDLDRFEDPGIFEALRELNLLLNETPERRRRRDGNRLGQVLHAVRGKRLWGWLERKLPDQFTAWLFGTGHPLRFVYALRDSVFEKLDAETAAAATQPGGRVDAAGAETMRANRTKFFDVVISLVPFISHRNARDLLAKMLDARGITDLKPQLVNTIAQHCTDMRLMRNMCNEYLVFAERLLEPKPPYKPAPEMDASHVFALVAYKNFHLGDFENITRRASALDRLYELHQALVRDNIAVRNERKRELLAETERVEARGAGAEQLGQRLLLLAEARRREGLSGYSHLQFAVGSGNFASEDVTGYEFWAAVARARRIDMFMATRPTGGSMYPIGVLEAELEFFAPEGLDPRRWVGNDATSWQVELDGVETDIEDLRRAGFAELARMPRFTPLPEGEAGESGPRTFAELVEETLESELACDLVRRGYIDRNFSLYAAQFYGNFTGLDVANFMVRHVQTNTPAIHYDLRRPGAVANLLDEAQEAGDELTDTVAAFNIDIVNHLLVKDHRRAAAVIESLIAGWGSDNVRTFLAAYFTSRTAERQKLAAGLAEHRCREVFAYLAGNQGVAADARTALFSAAASAFDPGASYDLSDDVGVFIAKHYGAMPAFSSDHPDDPAEHPAERLPERLSVLLERANVVIPNLRLLGERLRHLVIDESRYELTADNLRTALGTTRDRPGRPKGVPLEAVHRNDTVYAFCIRQLPAYLTAVDHDLATDYAATTPETLAAVLTDIAASESAPDAEQDADPHVGVIADLLAQTAPASWLGNLRAAPEMTWTALAAADRFRASLANMTAYRTRGGVTAGAIDTYLAKLLENAGTVHVDEPDDVRDEDGAEYDRQEAAVALLNTTHLTTDVRVNLAASLHLDTPLPAEAVGVEPNDLFAQMLARGLVADDLPTFVHIREGGWAAMAPAIKASTGIATFLEPAVVTGMVADLLADGETAAELGRIVVDRMDEFVPSDDWAELRAVARFAGAQDIPLPPEAVLRITRVADANSERQRDLTLRLLAKSSPAASADDIIAVFEHLGGDYARIRQTGDRLEFDRSDPHDQLLKVLADAGRINRGYPRKVFSATVN